MKPNLLEASAGINVPSWKRTIFILVSFGLLWSFSACESDSKSVASTSEDSPHLREDEDSDEEGTDRKRIVIFGNSITAGYQLNPDDAFPALIQHRLDSLGYESYKVVNAGVSGETSADGLNRLDWLLRNPVDIFMLELGGNDGLRGMELEETRENLSEILRRVRDRYPNAKLIVAGMEIPPNMGPDYTAQFREMFPDLADEYHGILIPFLLAGVAANPALNLDDGIHPNEAGHAIVADTLWTYLQPLLEPAS